MFAGPRQRQRLILHLGVHFGAGRNIFLLLLLFCGGYLYSADDVEVLPKKGSAGNNCKCEGGDTGVNLSRASLVPLSLGGCAAWT